MARIRTLEDITRELADATRRLVRAERLLDKGAADAERHLIDRLLDEKLDLLETGLA